MIELLVTLEMLIPAILICLVVLYTIIVIIKYKLDVKFEHDCYKCKHYELYDVTSCGGNCRYKCFLKNRYDNHNMNDSHNLVRCKEFESK
jgi:hypothetical protein